MGQGGYQARMATLPTPRGTLTPNRPLADLTWLRVGGPADWLFQPADMADLAAFFAGLDPAISVFPIGVGSNVIVRDGGIRAVVIRLGRGFNAITIGAGSVTAGAAALDAQVARRAAEAGLDLTFLRTIPGSIGGAVRMNAGCYGAETKDVLVEAYAINRAGERVTLSNDAMGFSYRRSAAAASGGLIFTGALFKGTPDAPEAVLERMEAITARREASQPIREKTGGSTFKNPEGHSAWKLVDEAGWRGKPFGGAQFSDLHANFLINANNASAADLEGLGEAVRADVLSKLGVSLEWEIKRIGRP